MLPLEMPPMPSGSAEERIKNLEEYLVRLILQLNEERRND